MRDIERDFCDMGFLRVHNSIYVNRSSSTIGHSGTNKTKCGSIHYELNKPNSEDQQHKINLMQTYTDDNSN